MPRAALLALLVSACAGARGGPGRVCDGTLADLEWLVGTWSGEVDGQRVLEHWHAAAGGMMLGLGHTVAGGRTVFFEHLRVEARADGLVYVAHPRAGAGVEFRVSRCGAGEVEFSNPAHDHPRRLAYRRVGDVLDVDIEGAGGRERLRLKFAGAAAARR